LPFYTLEVKEGWQKMGRTDDDDGKVWFWSLATPQHRILIDELSTILAVPYVELTVSNKVP
jgi:hypothetical protein